MDRRTFLKDIGEPAVWRQRAAFRHPPSPRARRPRHCASCRRQTSPTSIPSGAPSTWCAMPRRWSGTRFTASTISSQPQRQMAEGEEVPSDGLTWTFKLRPGSSSTTASRCWPRTWWPASRAGCARDFHGPDDQGPAEGADRGRRPHGQLGAVGALIRSCCSRSARTTRRWPSSCRSASPRPIRSSRSPSTSAAGR